MTDSEKEEEIRCSFCSKSRYETKHMIAGPMVNICDECVGVCVEIINENSEEEIWPPYTKVVEELQQIENSGILTFDMICKSITASDGTVVNCTLVGFVQNINKLLAAARKKFNESRKDALTLEIDALAQEIRRKNKELEKKREKLSALQEKRCQLSKSSSK